MPAINTLTERELMARATALQLALDYPHKSVGAPQTDLERAEEFRRFLMGEAPSKVSTITVMFDHEAGTYTVVSPNDAP